MLFHKVRTFIRRKYNPDPQKIAYIIIGMGVLQFIMVSFLLLSGAVRITDGPNLIVAVCGWLDSLILILAASGMVRAYEAVNSVELALSDLENFNLLLRAQRHDFKNHIQVVSALIDMAEYEEARNYLLRVNADMLTVNRANKTAHPAINALLEAKLMLCEKKGIAFGIDVTCTLDILPVPSWQVCRILGNVIDNAIDAIESVDMLQPFININIKNAPGGYLFRVSNNGPQIKQSNLHAIFLPEFSTKGNGRGVGLSIVKNILEECDGTVSVTSSESETRFDIFLPFGLRVSSDSDSPAATTDNL